MRKLFVAALLGAFAVGPAVGQEKKPALGVGDVPPPLKATKWVQGEEVKGFEKDKVYVVEFWATWCGPCIRAMPHLNELQQEYKAKGLVVIGFTSKDERNSQEAVEKFVAKNGKKFDYRFAYADDRATDKAYMEAAGQDGIPCSFVVGKDGKIAYIGHPMELDDVLPKVIEGTWKGKADLDAIKASQEALVKVLGSVDAALEGVDKLVADPKADAAAKAAAQAALDKALAAFTDYAVKNPGQAAKDQFQIQKMVVLMRAKKFDEAKVQAEAMIAVTAAKKKAAPAALAGMILGNKELNPDKKFLDLAVKGLDLALSIEKSDIGLTITAIDVYLLADKRAVADALGKAAIELAAAEGEQAKKEVTKIVEEKLAPPKK